MVEASPALVPDPVEALPKNSLGESAPPTWRLLIVDDDENDTVLVQRLFPPGIEVKIARTRDEARALVREGPVPDCALVDLMLPDGSGLDLVDDLAPTPVILITGHDPESFMAGAMSRGAQDLLSKVELGRRSLMRAIGFAVERTRRQRLQLQLEHGARLQQLGMMASALTHEIGNPLTFVGTNLRLAQSDLLGLSDDPIASELVASGALPELRELVDEAIAGVTRINGLVQQLHNLGRPHVDAEPAHPIDLGLVVRSAVGVAGARVREAATLALVTGPDQALVIGQPERVGQVLTNFLLNATQAIESAPRPDHRHQVEVRYELLEDRGVVWVLDDGPGIPEALDVGRLFQPFETTRHGEGGTGLGLAISSNIAASLGGFIDLRRREDGPGAVAVLALPRPGHPALRSPRDPGPEPEPPVPQRRRGLPLIDNLQGLLVDASHQLGGRLEPARMDREGRELLRATIRDRRVAVERCLRAHASEAPYEALAECLQTALSAAPRGPVVKVLSSFEESLGGLAREAPRRLAGYAYGCLVGDWVIETQLSEEDEPLYSKDDLQGLAAGFEAMQWPFADERSLAEEARRAVREAVRIVDAATH